MANIRGLSDLHKNMEAASVASSLLPGSIRASSGKQIIDVLFPGISWKMSIVWISIAQVIVYTVACIVGSNYLQPSDHTLLVFGGLNGPLVKAGQIWRLLLPIFLHAAFLHIFFNVLLILHMSLGVETRYGLYKFLILYFGSGVVGNLLAVAAHPCALSVGASTAGFGILGCLLSELALAWSILSQAARRYSIISLTIFFIMVLTTSLIPSVDVYGHIGGFLTGVFITLYYNKDFDPSPKWYPYAVGIAAALPISIIIASPIRIWAIPMQCE